MSKYPKKPDVSPDPILLATWNVGGPSAGRGTASKRKRAIIGLLESSQPDILLVQEFLWSKIENHRTWKGVHITKRYKYIGHKEAGILYDIDKLEVQNLTTNTKIRDILAEMLRKRELSQGFTPLGRMFISEIKTKGGPMAHFLCVSWHGSHNSRKKNDLLDELNNLLVFIKEIEYQLKLPFIIGGDFNVRYEDIPKRFVGSDSGLTAYIYEPLKGRKGKVIDYYIGSSKLPLAEISVVDLEEVENAEDTQKIFDHDPVEATLMTHA